jgi:hypothetical protein
LWLRLPLQLILIGAAYWYTISDAQGGHNGEAIAA